MDVVSLVALSVPLPVYPPHRLVWRDEKALSPTENKCNIVVLIEMSRPSARLNEPGCERRSSKYSSTSHCYHSLNLLLQTPRPRRRPVGGGRLWRPAGALGVLRTAAAAWAAILPMCSGTVGYGVVGYGVVVWWWWWWWWWWEWWLWL